MKISKAIITKRSIGLKRLVFVFTTLSTLLVIILLLFLKFGWIFSKPTTSQGWENRYFTVEQLKEFNGTNPKKPIYLGYEGKVYDVTTGSNFYGIGKTYNYLVGRDSTAELNEVGVGEIIVRKYPVIGKINN